MSPQFELQRAPDELSGRQALAVVSAVLLVIALLGAMVVAAVRMTHEPAAASSEVVVLSGPVQYRPVINNAADAPVPNTSIRLGNWTPARGVAIAERALAWLSWPYSFDGGNASGPTYGHAVDHDSRNDGHILGFDCSGLAIYALAPWLPVDHSAASQYNEAGTFHPALNSLQPGDLVFWSRDGTIAGVGHVAIYIGNGQVVQAPRSGGYIDVVSIDQVEPGSIGVTRPLT